MILTKKQEIMLYEWCISQGVNLQYGKVSLCDLRNFNYSQVYNNRRYQVHSDDPKCQWSMIYDELKPAVQKFVELLNKAKRVK